MGKLLISLNWTTTDLQDYRDTTDDQYEGLDDPDGDEILAKIDFGLGEDGNEDQEIMMDTNPTDERPIQVLKNQNSQESFALFCLGEVLNDNFMNQAQQNQHNAEHIANYNRFKTALININTHYMQSLNNQNESNNQKYIQLLKEADTISLT